MSQLTETQSLLKGHYLFRDLDAALVERIARLAQIKPVKAEDMIFMKGDDGDALYGVLVGKVRISATSADGRGVTLNIIRTGEFFGEIALLDGKSRTADAMAMEDGSLMTIHRREFLKLMMEEQAVTEHILALLCERVRDTSTMLEDAAFLPLSGRLAKRLMTLASKSVDEIEPGESVEIQISQADLGEMLGVTRESVNKQLQKWRKDDIVDLGRGRIIILDMEALEDLIEEDEFF